MAKFGVDPSKVELAGLEFSREMLRIGAQTILEEIGNRGNHSSIDEILSRQLVQIQVASFVDSALRADPKIIKDILVRDTPEDTLFIPFIIEQIKDKPEGKELISHAATNPVDFTALSAIVTLYEIAPDDAASKVSDLLKREGLSERLILAALDMISEWQPDHIKRTEAALELLSHHQNNEIRALSLGLIST